MPTITVRALDPLTREPQQGNGLNNFLSDLDAVTQILGTRMRLFEGEWFLNLSDGLPLFQSMLGSSGSQRNIEIITNLISGRITSFTPYVIGINSLAVSYIGRGYTYSAEVNTIFGVVTISNSPATLLSLGNSTS